MEVIPVIDLRGGVAVHAIAGERARYQPVRHPAVRDGNVPELAAFYARRKPVAIYVADLDAICGGDPQIDCWKAIEQECEAPLWIDVGVGDEFGLAVFCDFQSATGRLHQLVIGTETLDSEGSIVRIVQKISPVRVMLSLDRKEGKPLGAPSRQGSEEAKLIAARRAGIRDVIALDLATVGRGRARDFFDAWRPLLRDFAELNWYLGGGAKGREDLAAAEQAGFCGVLSATAILQGAL